MPSAAEAADAAAPARVHILLSTYNGAAWLGAQLDSIARQSCRDWTLHWRDDGSTDGSVASMRAFAEGAGQGRCVEHAAPAGNVGVLASYMGLLREVTPGLRDIDCVAFSDQDDVWLPPKLDRAMVALAWQQGPVVYCARYLAVDRDDRPLGESARLRRPTAFPAALTQNVATGCTIVLNRAAARAVAASAPPPATLHDWWSYLVVTAAGGRLARDEGIVMRYRQHGGNAVGVARTPVRRAVAAAGRGPSEFMARLRAHVAALRATPDLLSADAAAVLGRVDAALRGPRLSRLALWREPGLRRQTWWETAVLRLWALLG